MIYKVTVHISTLYIFIPNFINSRITFSTRYERKGKEEKLVHVFILYTRNFQHTNGDQILHNGEYQ